MMNHFFVIKGKIDADNEDAAIEFLQDLMFCDGRGNPSAIKIEITGTEWLVGDPVAEPDT